MNEISTIACILQCLPPCSAFILLSTQHALCDKLEFFLQMCTFLPVALCTRAMYAMYPCNVKTITSRDVGTFSHVKNSCIIVNI